jgi:pimeloyl-ACP methyl ester carboxylesterase
MSNARPVNQGFADLPGARIAYESAGDGEPIVFLHGGLLDGRMWDDQISFFAQQHRAIRYDMRGSGMSQIESSAELHIPYQDLAHLLEALAIPRASLVGLSGGARAAIDFAIAYPERVQKLVLVSPGMSGYEFVDAWTHERGAALMQALSQGMAKDAVEIFLTMWTDGPYRAPEQVDPAVREHIRTMVAHSLPLSRLAPDFQELDPPAVGRLAEIQAPTLIVLGDKDTPDILAIGKLLHEQVAGSELVMLPDVGHTLVMEKPAEFNALVDRFLSS